MRDVHRYSDRDLEILMADLESDLVERKESLRGDAPARIRRRILSEKRRHRDRHFDAQPVSTARLDDLDVRRFEEEYLPQAVDAETLAANDRGVDERLAAMKMITGVEDPRPTIAGILVLGRQPQDFLPGAYVQFLRVAGADLSDPVVDDRRCDGPIASVVRQVDDK